MEDLRDSNIKLYYKLVSIDHMRGYFINNYLKFDLSYNLIIDHILVDSKDKQINKTNQLKLNTTTTTKPFVPSTLG
jgi:hypothetical protein